MFKTLDDLADGQRVLMRVDLNSPVDEEGTVRDNRRFDRHAETVRELSEAGHVVVLMAHQGRPGDDDFVGLDQHATILADHLKPDADVDLDDTNVTGDEHPRRTRRAVQVEFVDDVYGSTALTAIRDAEAGDVLLLQNVRMTDDELPEKEPAEHAESDFVQTLAPEFDAYVDDAYSAAHRRHASVVGFPELMDAYAGRVMEAEYEANTSIAEREFDGDVTMVVGGTKATDVIDVMRTLGDRVDTFCLGGIAGELFLRAAGHPVGRDVDDATLFDEQWEANRETIELLLDERGDQIELASDLAYEGEGDERAEIAVDEIDEKDTSFLDVGRDTVDAYDRIVRDSAAVFVKGALGVFEDERFKDGTVGVLEAIAETDCFSVVGGGDTSRAIEMYRLDEGDFSHVSIAGGAYIRALTGQPLAGVEALDRAAERTDG